MAGGFFYFSWNFWGEPESKMTIPCCYSWFYQYHLSGGNYVSVITICIKSLSINVSKKQKKKNKPHHDKKMACFLSTSEARTLIQITWQEWVRAGGRSGGAPRRRIWCAWVIVGKPCSFNFNNGHEFVLSHPLSGPDVSVTKCLIFNKCLSAKQTHSTRHSY